MIGAKITSMDSHLCGYFSPPRLGCYVLGGKHPTEEQAFDRITAYTVERGRGHRVDTCAPGANPKIAASSASLQTRRRSPEGYIRQQRANSRHWKGATRRTFAPHRFRGPSVFDIAIDWRRIGTRRDQSSAVGDPVLGVPNGG